MWGLTRSVFVLIPGVETLPFPHLLQAVLDAEQMPNTYRISLMPMGVIGFPLSSGSNLFQGSLESELCLLFFRIYNLTAGSNPL